MADKNDEIFSQVTERQLQMLRVDSQMRKEILKELKDIERSLVVLLIEQDSFSQRRIRKMLAEVKILIKEGYGVINSKMIANLTELGEIEAIAMGKTFATVAVTTTDLPLTKITTLIKGSLIAGAPSEVWWRRQSEKLLQNFEDQLRTGVLLGENNAKLIRRVRGTKAFNFTNGIMNTSRRDAEALVRSSVQSASNQSRFEVMESVQDIIQSYRHVSTLDSRTSDICIVRDGKRWTAKEKKPIGHNLGFQIPPLHWNCRSAMISELKGVTLPDDATRASVDGPVKASTTFEGFLKGKSAAFVDEVLGKGKAQLWRNGKITLRQLLDQSGNPLTLQELRVKYN